MCHKFLTANISAIVLDMYTYLEAPQLNLSVYSNLIGK